MMGLSQKTIARIPPSALVPVEEKSRKKVHEEHNIQSACVTWFRLQYRQYAKLLYAVPNGSYKSKAAAGMMKAEGLTAGVADLCLAMPRGQYGALYIEMKQRGNYQQKNQREWQAECEKVGNRYVVCKSIDEFMTEVNGYMRMGVPNRKILDIASRYRLGGMTDAELISQIMKNI